MNTILQQEVVTFPLSRGSHKDASGGQCLLEAVSLFAGGGFTDCPACVDETLAEFGRTWNDSIVSNQERLQLRQYITRLPDTKGSEAKKISREWLCVDWLIRHYLVILFSSFSETVQLAEAFKALEPITNRRTLDLAIPHVYNVVRDENFLFADRDSWKSICCTALDAANEIAWYRMNIQDLSRVMDLTHQYTAKAAAQDNFPEVYAQLMASSHDLFSRMIDLK